MTPLPCQARLRAAALLSAAGVSAALACTPTLDARVPRSYLQLAPALEPGEGLNVAAPRPWRTVRGPLLVAPLGCTEPGCLRQSWITQIERNQGLYALIVVDAPELPASATGPHSRGPLLLRAHRASAQDTEPATLEMAIAKPRPGVLHLIPAALGERRIQALLARPLRTDERRLLLIDVSRSAQLELWQRALRRGHLLRALAIPEHLAGLPRRRDDGVNLVFTRASDRDGLLDALAQGHTQMPRRASLRPRLRLGVDLDADGRFDAARAGDLLSIDGDLVDVQIRVIGGRGDELLVYTERGQGPVERLSVARRDATFALRYPLRSDAMGFVRVELYQQGQREVVSNPLFFWRTRSTRSP